MSHRLYTMTHKKKHLVEVLFLLEPIADGLFLSDLQLSFKDLQVFLGLVDFLLVLGTH